MRALLRHRRILGESAWVFAGQGLSALATLIGVRLITEVVPPQVYGAVALAVGLVALANGLALGPLMQAVLRFHPEAARAGQEPAFRRATLVALRRPVGIGLAVLTLLGAVWALRAPADAPLAAMCVVLFVVEAVRSTAVTFFNAARRQREMAWLVIADAWLRPFVAVLLVWVLGAHAAVVVAGYAVGAALALATLLKTHGLGWVADARTGAPGPAVVLMPQMWRYALPLLPLPLIGWVSGQADRYLLGAFAGIEQAGLYAALYGLASKPFLMVGASVELALRQPYYERVSAGNPQGARKALAAWLAAVLASAAVLFALFVALHRPIAELLLAAEYRAHSDLMVWIAGGYVLLTVAQVFERVCYAHHDTRGVLLVQAGGAVLSVLVAVPLIWEYGIAGAAWAVPVYFGAQLAITAWRAATQSRRAQRSHAAAAIASTRPVV